jgi:hypothetical protein
MVVAVLVRGQTDECARCVAGIAAIELFQLFTRNSSRFKVYISSVSALHTS